MYLKAVTGKETFASGTAQCHTFVIPPSQGLTSEKHIGIAAKECSGITQQSLNRSSAAAGSSQDHGFWMDGMYEVEAGTILKVFGHKTIAGRATGSNRPTTLIGAKLIQLREGAAMRRLQFTQTGDPKATFSRVVIEGRFDVLTLKEAFAMQAQIDVTRVKQFQVAYMDRIFTETVMDREKQSRPQLVSSEVATEGGSVRRVQNAVPTRVVDLD